MTPGGEFNGPRSRGPARKMGVPIVARDDSSERREQPRRLLPVVGDNAADYRMAFALGELSAARCRDYAECYDLEQRPSFEHVVVVIALAARYRPRHPLVGLAPERATWNDLAILARDCVLAPGTGWVDWRLRGPFTVLSRTVLDEIRGAAHAAAMRRAVEAFRDGDVFPL